MQIENFEEIKIPISLNGGSKSIDLCSKFICGLIIILSRFDNNEIITMDICKFKSVKKTVIKVTGDKTVKDIENEIYHYISKINEKHYFTTDTLNINFHFDNFEVLFMAAQSERLLNTEDVVRKYKVDAIFALSISEANIIFRYFKRKININLAEYLKCNISTILDSVKQNEMKQIKTIELVSDLEKDYFLNKWNEPFDHKKTDLSMVDLFSNVVKKYPQKIAILDESCHISYRELDELSNYIVCLLEKYGLTKGSVIGIIAKRNVLAIVIMLGIIKLGGVYIPFSERYPIRRIKYMLNDCKADALIIVEQIIEKQSAWSVPQIQIDKIESSKLKSEQFYKKALFGSDLAYIIYTSGSTGQPKGVMVEHRNVVRLVKDKKCFSFNSNVKFLQTSSFTFDVSIFEIWGTLLNGGTLSILPDTAIFDIEQLERNILDQHINTMFLTTPVFHRLAAEKIEIFRTLDYLIVAGDVLLSKYANMFVCKNKNTILINAYGPTENTVFSSSYKLQAIEPANIPIGKPIAQSTAYVLDLYGNLQPWGAIGELYLGGNGVARGYVNNKLLTDKSFYLNPYHSGKMYKTGDIVRLLPDGNIEFLGRNDNQVKVRGFRIEINEIQNVITSIKNVKNSFVGVRKHMDDNMIYAFVVSDLKLEELEIKLRRLLPDYMIPDEIRIVDELPLNVNGKIDINYFEPKLIKEQDQSLTREQQDLCNIWESVLGRKDISIDKSFHYLGGNSILSIQVLHMLKEQGYHISTSDFLKCNTIRKLSKYITRGDNI